MTVIVEDGSGVTNANSYISIADADVYFGTRLYSDDWTGATELVKEAALLHATMLIDNYVKWLGVKSDSDQSLAWPRVGIYENQNVDGVVTQVELVDTVPEKVVRAQLEQALYLIGQNPTSVPDTAGFSELSISGAISFKVDKSSQIKLIPREVRQLLSNYGSVMGMSLRVQRV